MILNERKWDESVAPELKGKIDAAQNQKDAENKKEVKKKTQQHQGSK